MPAFTSRSRFIGETAALAAVTALAAFLRFFQLSELPTGMHGDEGVLGLLAQQIWREGSIGVYSGLGGGHPTGPDYFYALPVHFLGNTIFAVRLAPALVATLTIPALYLFLRRNVNWARPEPVAALLGAFLLAASNWHIHFSRIGYPLVMWPFFVLLASAAVLEAMRRRNALWWALAGAASGVGLFMYNAHALFLAALGLFIFGWLIAQRELPLRRRVLWLLLWLGVLLVVASPLILYALNPANDYFTHFRRDSLFTGGEWQMLRGIGGWGTKIGFLFDRYLDFWKTAVWQPRMTDTIDATGVTPIIRPLLFLLMAAGAFIAWRQRRSPLVFLGLFVILLMPLGYVTTTGGLARRSFAAVPFVATFAAIALGELWQWTRRRSLPLLALPIALLAFVTWRNLHDYFVVTARSPEQAWVYCEEFTKAVQYMKTLPPDAYVYFLSERWTFNYEPRQFLAPQVKGEDRSREFGRLDLNFDAGKGRPAFIYLGNYRDQITALHALYPNGRDVAGSGLFRNPDQPAFYAFWP